MNTEETLWRSFQSTLGKKIYRLPKRFKKKYGSIFKLKPELESHFNFSLLDDIMRQRVNKKIQEKKRTKNERKITRINFDAKQYSTLTSIAKIYSNQVFKHRDEILSDIENGISDAIVGMQKKSKHCNVYGICDDHDSSQS